MSKDANNKYSLTALEVYNETPENRWTHTFEESVIPSKSFILLKDQSFVIGASNHLYRFAKDGSTIVWEINFPEGQIINIALGYNEELYVGREEFKDGIPSTYLTRVDISGEVSWNTLLEDDAKAGDTPVVAESNFVFYSTSNAIYCLNGLSGEISWYKRDQKFNGHLPAISPLNRLIITTNDNYLMSINVEDGVVLWNKKLERTSCHSPVVDGIGNILLVTGGCFIGDSHNATLSMYDSQSGLLWETPTADGYLRFTRGSVSHILVRADGSIQLSCGSYYVSSSMTQIRNPHGKVTINSNSVPVVLHTHNETCVTIQYELLYLYRPTKIEPYFYITDSVSRQTLDQLLDYECLQDGKSPHISCCLFNREIIPKTKDIEKFQIRTEVVAHLKQDTYKFPYLVGLFTTQGVLDIEPKYIPSTGPEVVNITGFNIGIGEQIYCQYVPSENNTNAEVVSVLGSISDTRLASCPIPKNIYGQFCVEISPFSSTFTRSCYTKVYIEARASYNPKAILGVISALGASIFAIIIVGVIHVQFCQRTLNDELDLLEINDFVDEDFKVDNYEKFLLRQEITELDTL